MNPSTAMSSLELSTTTADLTAPVISRSDVLVVGGGPAGVAAAVTAARSGASVTLLERYSDLGGLASNSEMPSRMRETLLEAYFGQPVTDQLRFRFAAMTAASLLRETMWSMVSEIHSQVDFDFAKYTADNLARYDKAFAAFRAMRRA